MWKRVLVAILVVGGLMLALPRLEEAQDLEFEAYATIQAQPREAERSQASIYRAALRLATRNPDEAREQFEGIAASEGPFASQARELASAIRAAQLEENKAYTFTLLGQAFARVEAWEQSAQALEQAVAADPNYAEAWAYLGEARQQAGLEGGREALQEATSLNPASVSVNLFQALFWQRQGDFERANRHLHISRMIEPANPQLWIELGHNQVLAGNLLEAREYYQQAVELEPQNPALWKQFAHYSLSNHIFVEEVALPAAERALSLAATDPEALNLAAQAYWQLDYGRGLVLRFLDAALSQNSNYAEAHLLSGIVHLELGQAQQAREHLERVVALEETGALAAQAQALITELSP